MSAAEDAVKTALQQLGDPYVWGAEGPDEFDCSGLTQFAYGLAGIDIPRTADQQMKWADPVTGDPKVGDLVFWTNSAGRATHVGLYIGDGRVVDAPGRGREVIARPVWGDPVYGRVPGAGGGLLDTVGDIAGAPVRAIDGLVTDAIGSARDSLLRALLVAGGLGLTVLGAWAIATRPGRAYAVRTAREAL